MCISLATGAAYVIRMAPNGLNPQFVVNSKGQKKSVLLSVTEYNRLMQRLDDLDDALELDDAVRGAKGFRDYPTLGAS